MNKLKWSLTRKALMGIVIIFLPVLITFGLVYNHNRVYLKNRILDTLTVIAEAYEGQVYQFLEKAKVRAQDFASDGFIRTHLQKAIHGNTSAMNKLNKHLTKNKLTLDKTINTINVLSLEGRVIASTNSAEIGSDYSSETIFQKGKETVTMVEKCFGHCELTEIAISAPILNKDTGRLIGVIVNYSPIAELDTIVTRKYSHDLGAVSWGKGKGDWQTLEVYLVNRDKRMITKSIFVKDAVGKQVVDTLPVNEGLTSNKGINGFFRGYRGVEVAGASMYIPSMKWVLLVEIDKNEVLLPVKNVLLSVLITEGVVFVMVVFLFTAFRKRVVRPICLLSGAANDIARGNFDIAIPIKTSDEIGMLCESFNSMSRDIKSRTTELIESEAHLTEAQRIAHIGNCAWDVAKNKLYGSDEAYRIFGLTQQKFDDTYETFLNCVHPEDREFVNKSLNDALNNKKSIDIEHRILLKDTTVRIVQKKCVPILNDSGKVIRLVGTVQDITERKRAEEELITEKNKFLAVINAMEDGLTIQDLDYNIIYQNETIKNIFGVRLGEKCYSTYEGKNSICDGCPVEMVYKDGKSHISERRVVLPSGEIVFYENIASPIIDASGKIVSCLEIARNITGRKQAEAEMHLLQTIIMEISASKDLHEALIVTIRKVCDVTGWVYGEAWKLNPDGTLLERNHAYYSSIEGFEKFSAFAEGMTFPLGIGLPGRAWSKKQPVWIPDVTLDPQYLRVPIAREVGLKAGIAFPIIADNEVIAVAVFYKLEAEERDERLIKLVSAVMSQLGSVIKRKQAEELLKERAYLAALGADVGFALAQKDSLQNILQKCTDALVRNLNVAFARIWTLNKEENVLELQSSAGIYTHIDGPHRRVPVGMYKIGLIAGERKPHLTNTVIGDPRIHDQEWAKKMGMVAFAGYPLMIEDRTVGVMAMFARQPLTAFTLKALASVSDVIALGIERKQVEKALWEAKAQYELLFEGNPHPMFVVDQETLGCLAVNSAAVNHYGYSREEFLGMAIKDICLSEDMQKFLDSIALEKIVAGPIFAGIRRHRKKDGTITDVEITGSTLVYYGRKALLLLAHDITERKKMEEEQAKLREQLYHVQKIESVGTLAGGIAHDFNNILTAIIGFGSLLQTEIKENVTAIDFVQKIMKSAERAANLTRGLLIFSRKQPTNPEPVNLNDAVRNVESVLERVIREDIKFKTLLTDKNCIVIADINQIEQVLMNLATNARDAMPNEGSLTISTDTMEMDDAFIKAHGYGAKGMYALISVSDTGIGMDEITKQKIFEPFFTTKEVGKGTGLGLAIVYGIVMQHNGYINVYSEPGKGTTFRIYLPLIKSAVEKAKVEIHTIPKGGTETILLAEDDAEVRNLMKIALKGHGYKVIEAVDGGDVINKFKENKDWIQLLILDVIMPIKNGKEAYDAIKKMKPDMKAVLMSGYSEDIIKETHIIEEGLNFISKPVLPMELLRMVRDVLDR